MAIAAIRQPSKTREADFQAAFFLDLDDTRSRKAALKLQPFF